MQHFLLSPAAKTLSLAQVFCMTEAEAEAMFAKVRWPDTEGKPVCPHCGGLDAYEARRPNGSPRFRCRACKKDFTLTAGTLFASHKMPLKGYLAAIAIFCNEVKGKFDARPEPRSSHVVQNKFRSGAQVARGMATEMKGRAAGGEGKTAELDTAYFGGYVKPANIREHRADRRLAANQSGKRKAVVVIRERNGATLPAVFRSEGQALSWIKAKITIGTVVNADEAGAWNELHAKYEMKRINHEEAYSLDGACINWAESYFSRMRRGEIGHHHHVAGPYLLRYAQEASWREDCRRMSNGEQVNRVAGLAMVSKPSVDFAGYWQRHQN
jgi:hypothetical protein